MNFTKILFLTLTLFTFTNCDHKEIPNEKEHKRKIEIEHKDTPKEEDSTDKEKTEFSEEFSVMTYNIRYKNPSDGLNGWLIRKSKVISIINKHNPDIFGVQEALHTQVLHLEGAYKNKGYVRIGVGRDDGKEEGEYAAIFFNQEKFKLLNSGYFWLSETPEKPSLGWDATCCNRIATWVFLKGEKVDFYVFNTHFDHEGVQAQKESAKLILSKIKEIAQGKPVILMGDFNIIEEDEGIRILREGNLTDGFSIFKDKGNLPTKATFNAFKTNEEPKYKIDYIFASPQVKFLDYTIDNSKIRGRYPSDHFPIWAKVKITESR